MLYKRIERDHSIAPTFRAFLSYAYVTEFLRIIFDEQVHFITEHISHSQHNIFHSQHVPYSDILYKIKEFY